MSLEVFYNYRDSEANSIKGVCRSYRFYHVILKMDDGSFMDGIIESIDGDNITLLVGEDIVSDDDNNNMMSRQPRNRNRHRRYRPRNYPINRIGGIGLVGYPIIPPIYPYPPYPYPYYPY